jgi:hypothetical protein
MLLSYLQVRCPSGALVAPWPFDTRFGSPLQLLQAYSVALEPSSEAILLRKGRLSSPQAAY